MLVIIFQRVQTKGKQDLILISNLLIQKKIDKKTPDNILKYELFFQCINFTMFFFQASLNWLTENTKLAIMKMAKDIACNCGDKILVTQVYCFYCLAFISNAEDWINPLISAHWQSNKILYQLKLTGNIKMIHP